MNFIYPNIAPSTKKIELDSYSFNYCYSRFNLKLKRIIGLALSLKTSEYLKSDYR